MNEQLLLKFKLPMLNNLQMIEDICYTGYMKTGRKFSVIFNGSKGYLSNIEITCEGFQTVGDNVICIENQRTKKGGLKSKMVSIYHSNENGVRIDM